MGFGQQQQPTKLNQAQINQSAYGYPLPWVMGTARIQQSLLWEDGFGAQTVNIQGGKGGGKGGTEYLYFVDCIAALCNGPILGIGDVWSGQSWLGLPNATESYTIAAPGIYTPTNAPAIVTSSNNQLIDVGVGRSIAYSGTFHDLGAPAATVLSGSYLASFIKVPFGTTLTSGTYSINPNSIGTFTLTSVANASGGNTAYTGTITGGGSNAFAGYTFTIAGFTNAANNGSFVCASSTATTLTLQNASGVAQTHAATATEPGNTYHFDATHDAGKTLTLSYSFYLPNITETETDIVPAGKQIVVGGSLQFLTDLGVVYTAGPNNGTRLTKVNATPTVTGTYQCIPSGHGGTYKFATGDISAQVRITWITQDLSIVPQGAPSSLNFQLFEGTQGQSTWSVLTSKYPGAALGYSSKAYVAYHPMALGTSGQISNNTFEVVTPDIYGGGIKDCNPIQCIGQVLTNQQCGLGVGLVAFPTSVIDNGPNGTWGGAPSTPGTSLTGSTAWNWFAANGFFISPVLDSQDTAASTLGKWLEAGMCSAFYSEGLLKLVPYGDTTTAGSGCTWTAPTAYAVALDDTCYLGKEGEDPVKITRSAPQDAMNAVQVQWNNRSNQYSPEITQESDQASINKWGERREDPQNWDFIHTLTAATFAANMRVKHNVYIRNTYEFTLPFTYSYLEPMDIISLSTTSTWAVGLNNANLGLVNQPARITKIVDDPLTGLAITCEDYPWGAHLPTIYNKAISTASVVSNAYANPGNVEVVMFEATSRLTGYAGNTIYIGACGTSSNYGSTNIWVSRDNTNFEQVGTIQAPARLGVLDSTFASGSDPDTVNSLVIDLAENCGALAAGSTADADNNVTLCFVDGEYIASSAAALSGQQQYTMNGYIRRGLFGTAISSHAAGSLFMRLDQSIFKYQYDPTWAGQTLYFKFQPVNAFGNSATPLASLGSQAFTVLGQHPGAIDAASGLIIPYSQDTGVTIQNANFEAATVMSQNGAPAGWMPEGTAATITYDTATPYDGSQSLKLVAADRYRGVQNQQKYSCTPGDQYKLTFAGKLVSGGMQPRAGLWFENASGFVSAVVANITSGSWTALSVSGTVPAGATFFYIVSDCEYITSASTTTWEIDKFQLVRVSSLDNEVSDGSNFVKLLASHAVNNVAYNFRGIWTSGTTYFQGDEVIFGQSYWVALAGSLNSSPNTGNSNWQVVGSYSGFQGAWSSSTAYIAGAEVTFSGNYWVCVTGNTNSAPSTSNANWQVAGPSSLDNIADGGVYLRTSYIAGDALLDNGNFEASSSILPPPGYTPYANTATLAYDTTTQFSGAQSIKITSPSAGGAGILPIKKVMCRAGDVFFASARAKWISGSGAADLSISFRNASGTGIGGSDVTTSSSSWTLLTNTQTAPAGTVYATFEIYANAANTTVEFDEHYIRCVRNLDTEVADGSTYGKVNQTALTGNNIDPSKGGVLAKGSTPTSQNGIVLGGMTWNVTSNSWQPSWTQTPIFRADGTISGFIAGGTLSVTGLLPSQSYTAYPYWDETSSTMKWVGSELVFPTMTSVGLNGSTQYLTTTTSANSLPTQFTLEAWIKTTASSGQQVIMSLAAPQTGTGAPTHEDMIWTVGPAGNINFQYVNGSGSVVNATTTGAQVSDGAWHHIVIAFATGGTITIYVDGVSKGTASALGAPRNAGFALWYRIGFGPANASFLTTVNSFFNGSLSQVALYTGTPLTSTQVSNHFITGINVGFTVTNGYANTVAADTPTYYWKLNEMVGTSAAESIASNTGTYVGSPTLNQQAPVVVPSGSPAYMWPYKNYLCSQAQSLQSRIPLSAGSLNPSTPASGSVPGGGGGIGGGGQGGCWSGNTLIRTQHRAVRIDEWLDGTEVLTARGTWRPARLLCHEIMQWKMIDPIGNGELVTIQHWVLENGGWMRAHVAYRDIQTLIHENHVYDLIVLDVNETETEALSPMTEHSYTLESGIVAHNAIMLPK
jgi:hypothetical protein